MSLEFSINSRSGGTPLISSKVPAVTKSFAGHWRIVEMDVWDKDVLDIGEEAHLTFKGVSQGEIAFVAVKGFLDVRYGLRDGAACARVLLARLR